MGLKCRLSDIVYHQLADQKRPRQMANETDPGEQAGRLLTPHGIDRAGPGWLAKRGLLPFRCERPTTRGLEEDHLAMMHRLIQELTPTQPQAQDRGPPETTTRDAIRQRNDDRTHLSQERCP